MHAHSTAAKYTTSAGTGRIVSDTKRPRCKALSCSEIDVWCLTPSDLTPSDLTHTPPSQSKSDQATPPGVMGTSPRPGSNLRLPRHTYQAGKQAVRIRVEGTAPSRVVRGGCQPTAATGAWERLAGAGGSIRAGGASRRVTGRVCTRCARGTQPRGCATSIAHLGTMEQDGRRNHRDVNRVGRQR